MRGKIILATLLSTLTAYDARLAAANDMSEREIEAALLHRQISLDSVQVYSRAQKSWQPLRSSRARVRVINLWSRTCQPCLAEMPHLATVVNKLRAHERQNVQFLFIADPPTETSAHEVVEFWTNPWVDSLADRCPGIVMIHGDKPSCMLKPKDLPDEDPARWVSLTNQLLPVLARPLTLLVDEQGTIRQVFAGSLNDSRREQLIRSTAQLLNTVSGRASAQVRRPGGGSHAPPKKG